MEKEDNIEGAEGAGGAEDAEGAGPAGAPEEVDGGSSAAAPPPGDSDQMPIVKEAINRLTVDVATLKRVVGLLTDIARRQGHRLPEDVS